MDEQELKAMMCEIFTTAKERLPDAEHWTQGAYLIAGENNDKYCLLGACSVPYLGVQANLEVSRILREAILAVDNQPIDVVHMWNDDPERKFEDVRKVIEYAHNVTCTGALAPAQDQGQEQEG